MSSLTLDKAISILYFLFSFNIALVFFTAHFSVFFIYYFQNGGEGTHEMKEVVVDIIIIIIKFVRVVLCKFLNIPQERSIRSKVYFFVIVTSGVQRRKIMSKKRRK